MTDKRIVNILSASLLAVLLVALLVPLGESARIVAACILLPAAVLFPIFVKKRNILSINKNQVLLIMTVIGLVYLMLYYLSGIEFGFYMNPYGLSVGNFFRFFLPVCAIIVFTEIIRFVMQAQEDKLSRVLCYFSCVIAEMLIYSNIPSVTNLNRFMDLIAGALFPALIFNLLYNYLSKRYGLYPNLIFRSLFTLHAYTFPIQSGISESLLNFFKILLPIAIYLFVDMLYEKKKRYALVNRSRFWRVTSRVISIIVLLLMLGAVMLVSNQFRYGSYVIATPSMTGELNEGDIAVYESYDDQLIVEGQVIVFEKNSSMIIHRVIKIENINGTTRYYTKGDANEDADSGFITSSDIRGVVRFKLSYLGYPTLWLRDVIS